MHKTSVLSNNGDDELFYFGNKNHPDTKFVFYTPKISNSNTKSLYFINTQESKKLYANLVEEKHNLLDHDFISNQLSVYPKYKYPLHLIKISITYQNDKLKIIKGNHPEKVMDFWAFQDPQITHLYPLTLVVWPPGFHIYKKIENDIRQQHRIWISKTHLLYPSNTLSKLVYKLYEDDRRCNKKNLIYKIKAFQKYPLHFRFINILVKDPKLNAQGISRTIIGLKNKIRRRYKHLIPDYFYDIMIHSSDNAKHSKNIMKIANKGLDK